MSERRRMLAAAVLVMLLATFLRFHLLGAQSFWNDEGNSARLSERAIPAIIEGTASDIHPPFYYLALRGWRELVGETEFGLRALSAFAGVLAVAVVVAVGKILARRREDAKEEKESLIPLRAFAPSRELSAAVAGLLAAVSPVLVYYSQETRMYSLLALLSALSGWVLLVWLAGPARPWRWAAAYVVLLAAGLYTHYFFPAVIAAQGVVVLWKIRDTKYEIRNTRYEIREEGDDSYLVSRISYLLKWVALAAVAGLVYAPWVPVFLRQIGGRGDAAGATAFATESARWLVLGSTVRPGELAWAVWAFVGLLLLGAVAGGRRAAAPLALAFVPLLLMFLVGATDPAFFKFMLAVAPFLCVVAGLAWNDELRITNYELGGRAGLWAVVVGGLTVAVLAGGLLSLANMYGDPAFARADYRGMAARIAAEAHPNAGVLLVAPNQWEAFTYYHNVGPPDGGQRDGAPVYPLPRGRPDPALVVPELEAIAAAHDRIYALFWGEAQRDPERVIERWLDANAFKASEEWVGDVRFVVYALPGDPPPATPSGATFAGLDGERIVLHEYSVWPEAARPGDLVQAQLVWSADEPPERAYKVFLHLLDSEGRPVAQRDGEPGGGSRPTTSWAAGERVTDNHGLLLPLDLPPGEYTLRLGLYDAFEPGTRLMVDGADGLDVGRVVIGDQRLGTGDWRNP